MRSYGVPLLRWVNETLALAVAIALFEYQVPGDLVVAYSDHHLVTVKPAVEERRAHIERKANKAVRAPPQDYSLPELGCRLI